MSEELKSKCEAGFFDSLSPDEKKFHQEWLESESDRAEARADSWTEKGLRLVLVLNTGGVLSLLTAVGSLLGSDRSLDPLILPAVVFLLGVVIAAFGILITTWFFNYFAKWTNDMYRLTVSNVLTAEKNKLGDEEMSARHTGFQRFVLAAMAISFAFFCLGAAKSLLAIQEIGNQISGST